MRRYANKSMSRPLIVVCCLIGIAVNCLIIGPVALQTAYEGYNDFRHFYIGAKLAGDSGLYNINYVLAIQQQLIGKSNQHLLPNRLPFYYALLSPLARLPYRPAFFFWLGSLIFAVVLFVLLCPCASRATLALACCWSLPLIFSLAIGQDVAFVLLSLGAALWAFYRGKPLTAGAVLSLCLIKFHLFLLLPLLILGKREWRLGAGLFSGAALLLGASFLVSGWQWPKAYASILLEPESREALAVMPNLHGLAANFPIAGIVEVLMSAIVAGIVYLVIRREPFDIALAATLVGSLLLSRHTYLQDCAILIPSLVLLTRPQAGPVVRCGALILALPFAYVFVVIALGTITALLLLLLLVLMALSMKSASPAAGESIEQQSLVRN